MDNDGWAQTRAQKANEIKNRENSRSLKTLKKSWLRGFYRPMGVTVLSGLNPNRGAPARIASAT